MNPQYKDYNYVKVTIKTRDEEYVISNVNTKGVPGDKCGAHLQSVDINEPLKGSENSGDISSSGSITIIDYGDAVFSVLNKHMQQFLGRAEEAKQAELLPKIEIEVRCFTNTRKFYGRIQDWNLQFSGTIPSVQLNWSVILPSDAPVENPKPGNYKTPKALISAIKETYPDSNVAFVTLDDGSDASDKIKFINGSLDFDLTKIESCKNKVIDTYRYIVSNSVTNDGLTLSGELVSEDKFAVYINDPKQNSFSTEEGTILSQLIFIQNGRFKEYSCVDGKYVIPMTSFSFNNSMYQLPIQKKIVGNVNGTMSIGTGDASLCVGPTDNVSKEAETIASSNNSAPIKVSFECYNTMAFSLNNTKALVRYDVYNELGKKHILSGYGIASKCSYNISGGVVKATVECTEEFNSLNQSVEEGASAGGSQQNMSTSSPNMSYASSGGSSSSSNSSSNNMGAKDYLCTEDSNPVSLSLDRTAALVTSGDFDADVQIFLDRFGNTTSTGRLLGIDYVNRLIENKNFGLLTLLIAVANYGISGPVPSTWNFDAVNQLSGYGKRAMFCASDEGKKPYDYTVGGLGIAHWDSGNLDDIYTAVGFPQDISKSDQDHFSKLLVTDGSIKKWEMSEFKIDGYAGITRMKPVFSKSHPDVLKFDNGLKRDDKWLEWAYSILYYRDDEGRSLYQYYLFRLWVQKFWNKTVASLKSTPGKNGHTPSLQDAVRISRAGNSATGLIDSSVGKTVEQQYVVYYNDQERYIRQKAFCRRCADIIGWECG